MKRLVLSSLGLCISASVALAHPLDGQWDVFADRCKAIFTDTMTTIDTKAGTISFFESGCEILSLEAIGGQGLAWQVELACSGEGMNWTQNAIFALDEPFDGGPIRLIQIDLDDGYVVARTYCAALER